MKPTSVALCAAILLYGLTAFTQQTRSAKSTASLTVPHLVKFGGVVSHTGSKTVGITFALYKEQQGGAPLWLETQNVSLDAKGRYSVLLGASKAEGVPMELFTSGEARWLGMQVENQKEQSRVLLVSVPYALKAGDAETVGGNPPSAFLLAPSAGASTANRVNTSTTLAAPSGSGTTNFVPLWTSSTNLGNSALFQTGGAGLVGNVGIGTQTPAAKLDVKGGAFIRGVLNLPATGAATSTAGTNSNPLSFTASSFKSGTGGGAVNQTFRWQAEPTSNNTASPSAKLSLQFTSPAVSLRETGFGINSGGIVSAPSLRVGNFSFLSAPITKSAVDISTLTPTLALTNNSGGLGATVAIDFNTFQPSSAPAYNPSARISAVDAGGFGNDIVFLNNTPGSQNAGLAERMRIRADGKVFIGPIDHLANYGAKFNVLDDVNGTPLFAVTNAGDVRITGTTLVNLKSVLPTTSHVCYDGSAGNGFGALTLCSSAAEYVPTIDGQSGFPAAGDLVRVVSAAKNPYKDEHSPFVVSKTSKPCDDDLMGFLLDPKLGAEGTQVSEHYLPLAMYGYFPAKVTMQNGPIRRGDPITSSSKPGYGMKATGACKIIGYALEDAKREGTVRVFAHLSENAAPKVAKLQARMSKLHRENVALRKQLLDVVSQVRAIRIEMRRAALTAEHQSPPIIATK